MASNSIARLQPINEMIYPNAIEPTKIPIQLKLPIQESRSFVNGPEMSGVSSEANKGSAGATQPRMNNSG